jgi:tetratricopeptide (TPR) repeat protein
MFTPFSRIILLLLCAALSVAAAVFNIYSLLIITSIASFILLWGYFRKGSVPLALRRLRNGEYKEAEEVLAQTGNVERLEKKQKAYYLFVKGFIAREKDQYEEAKIFLEESLNEGIGNQNDIAMALLALADMEMVKNNKRKAMEYFAQLKDLKVKSDLMLSIRKMQDWLGWQPE